ncbi:universal stress protein [Rhizobium sp. TRM95796]|uniref:universal stress protein n=1 Tax=Rhizobium sp. TRM95796 TaxID=2979862 RepID=UPI0021E9159F|nr:universal stress protein [Rhizobium sp. TRM95796]MCV3764258.1 universal stress protein [Rhizobium sp. TRM95796]
MPIKTIAVVLSDPKTAQAVTSAAIGVARKENAHLIGLHAEIVDPPPIMTPFDLPDSSIIASLYEAAGERRKAIEAMFNEATAREGVSAEWRASRGTGVMASQALIDSCRISDLVIASQPASDRVGDVDELLFETGRPALFIPWIDQPVAGFNRVLVAWDGSRESTRAVFDAIPLIKDAAEIELFSVDPQETNSKSAVLTGADLAESLARHGLKVTTNTQDSERVAISAVLENRCTDFAADLLVMGAYSHARIRERLFGGVTQIILESMTVPVFMSR